MITVHPSYGDSVTSPPSQITRVSFDQVREIYTDNFYGSRRGFINMSWDRPNGIFIYHHSSTYLNLCFFLSTGFEHLAHYKVEFISNIRGCHDPAEEQTEGVFRFVNKTYTLDKVGVIAIQYNGVTRILTNHIIISLQNATSLLVKAKTPADLPAFSTGDIHCLYHIRVSISRNPFPE